MGITLDDDDGDDGDKWTLITGRLSDCASKLVHRRYRIFFFFFRVLQPHRYQMLFQNSSTRIKMRFTILTLTAALCLALVSSHPLPEDGLRSEALDRLVMAEADNEAALRSKRTIGILRQLFPDISKDVNPESENQVNEIGSESQNNEVRVQFADEVPSDSSPQELTPLDETQADEDENRNKRFLFGLGGGSGGGAGSGNFLFDIIRQAADGAARAAGTVYRVVAGTQSLGLGLSASRDVGPAAPAAANPAGGTGTPTSGAPSTAAPGAGILPLLVAGSGSNSLGSSGSLDGKSDDDSTHHEAVPGPVTRFFVIANRGLSNLVQDLILRLAATSERFVNFKARLITSII
ncbi:uncharacterized protein LOC105201020 isoform X2 [Solenopsis invicta]|uniref:uncharacterized protein LOC105201020 isoform X2 n=1 Tax=Solenopsis invicta TaxID=13686 RepID=UPI000595A8C0|nr:uncharacterized protein LOC105201020 isoform X2 [Solenopsis invicta]